MNIIKSENIQYILFMASRKLLSKISFNPEEINKVKIITRERIELDKTKSIATKIKKVWEQADINMRVIQER